MVVDERLEILEEEIIILENSGEIPEIALHTTLYYLTRDEDGPQISLRDHELQSLYDAAEKRYREIVLRDLMPQNRDLSIYRGIARSIVNWRRYQNFCSRIGRDATAFRASVRRFAVEFFIREYQDVTDGHRLSSINCCSTDLKRFFDQLEVDAGSLPENWQVICPE